MNQRSPHPPHMDSSGMASHPTWEESSSHMVHQGHQLRVPPHHSGDGSYAMDSYGRVSSHFGNPHGHIPTSKPRMPHQLAVEHHHCDVSSDSDRQNSSPTCSTPTLQGPHSTRKKLLVSSKENQTDRDFYLDDPVVLFDNDGRRVQGVVKWAVPGKERGVNCYIIGIETVRAWVGTDSITSCVHNSCSLCCTHLATAMELVLMLLRKQFPYKFHNSILCLGMKVGLYK